MASARVDAETTARPTLFAWPSAAKFGRVVPKSSIYEHSGVTPVVRERFVQEVKRITWAFKLADDTVRLSGSSSVPEIQVFVVEAKSGDVSDKVLSAIDKAVHFPIIFEIADDARVRTVAAQKTLGPKSPAVGPHFSSPWLPVATPRTPLPTALDLPHLYEELLRSLLPTEVLEGESVAQATARMERVQELRREIAALGRKIRNEPQLNRKIEIRKQLKERESELSRLTATATATKDSQWTS